ncbi:hypothetical protein WD019_11980 [Fictibacillus sp. Mic-4]|uniref:hypothetical protein n=1 Tax=Fictibacillus sp. Mic-4 TaxID=3132826 RepID=UPI003CF8706C
MLIIKVILSIVPIVIVIASIAAWFNTQVILRELAEIKNKLGIKEEKNPSFLNRDLDD